MRRPKYLSPSSLYIWETNKEDYYLQYLADNRPPRQPQTQPMSVGSAFDAYIKNYLYQILFGKDNSKYDLEVILEQQVEPQNMDYARTAGKECFEAYIKSGAAADLLIELRQAKDTPRFEFSIEKNINGVNILGKTDLFFVNKDGIPIILDWKVNGYGSKWPTYPRKGYVRVRPGRDCHKDAFILVVNGIRVNVAHGLEDIDESWARQLATYAWLCGAEVGSDFIVMVDQLCCNDTISVAEHRLKISEQFQTSTFNKYNTLWDIIMDDDPWIFKELTFEESKGKCQLLDQRYKLYDGNVNLDLMT